MKIEEAFSLEFGENIDVETAYDLYWAGIIREVIEIIKKEYKQNHSNRHFAERIGVQEYLLRKVFRDANAQTSPGRSGNASRILE